MLDEVVAVVADVVGQRPEGQVGDARDDGVQKEAIVADQDDRVRIRVQVRFEPVARLEIEVVRRLVEQEQVRLAEQQLGQRDAHLPSAGERFGRPLEVGRREAEALQHGRRLELDRVAVVQAEAILQVAVAREHVVVLGDGNRRVAEPGFEGVHLRLHARAAGRRRSMLPRRRVRPAWVRPSCGR